MMKTSQFLLFALLAIAAHSTKAQNEFDSVSTGEFNAPNAPSTCRPDDNFQSGDSCSDDGLSCGFDNMSRICTCNGSTWTCVNEQVNLPTPAPAPTNSPKPTCDGTASGCVIGGAYFTDTGEPVKSSSDANVESLDVGSSAAAIGLPSFLIVTLGASCMLGL